MTADLDRLAARLALAADDDERLGAVTSGSGLEFGAESAPALVCYEALSPWRWPLGGNVLVLTNHRPFSRPGTASRAYDLTLRQIARATGSAVMLAANKGSAGVFGAMTATVSPRPTPRRCSAEASRRQRA